MERRDYLMREIEKLTAVIKKLVSLIEGLDSDNYEENIQQINKDLVSQTNFNLDSISEMTEIEFLSKIKNIDEENLELFAKLLSEISNKLNLLDKETKYNSKDFAKKSIVTLDYLDEKTKTFSFKRNTLKKELQQLIAK